MNTSERKALAQVLEVARRELAEWEPDDVPTKLRRIKDSSARTLPPPFADSLLDALSKDDTFRSVVADRWEAEGRSDPVGAAFLQDPEEAQILLDAIAADALVARNDATRTELEHKTAALGEQLAEAKVRIVQIEKAARSEIREGKRADKRTRKSLEEAAATARREASAATDTAEAAAATSAALQGSLDAAEQTIERLQKRLRKKGDTGAQRQTRRNSDAPQDPMLLAIWLDTMERRLRPYRDAARVAGEQSDMRPLHLPSGVSPDTREAVDALIVQAPMRFIIDGYNVSGAVDEGSFSTRAGRETALAISGRLVRMTDARVLVVFDAPGVHGRDVYTSDFGAEVRFSREGSADDTIVQEAASQPNGTVVITNDREVRERASAVGALAIWSDALIAWAKPS
jgi:hypothetical protein